MEKTQGTDEQISQEEKAWRAEKKAQTMISRLEGLD